MVSRRLLTADERKDISDLFRDSVDVARVTVTRGSIAAFFSATTIGNAINLQRRDFVGDTMVLNIAGWATLIHEIGHVWQYQNGGMSYLPRALWANLKAFLLHGDRDKAYDWPAAVRAGTPWEKWNPEQQAECIACYARSLRRKQGGKNETAGNAAGLDDDAIVAMTAPYMALVRQRTVRRT